MITVHGSAVPFGASCFFFVWGMDPRLGAGERRRALAQHPQAVAPEHLFPLVAGLPHVNALTCTVLLPDGPAKFPGLAISAATAAQWLPDLDRALARSFTAGQSLRAWSVAAKLLQELLARGRFVPLLRAEAGCLTADWHLSAPEPADAERLDRLEAAIPGLCRAIVPPDRNHKQYKPPETGALLSLFLRTATGALARQFLEGVPDRPAARSAGASAAQHWLLALTGQEGRDLPPGLPDATALYQAVDEWLAPASGERGLGALRTGLRLRPPADTVSEEWELELFLQTNETPPARVSARTAWDALGADLEIGGGKFRAPEQRLLSDLPTLARLFPPLAPLADEAAPEAVPLNADDVSRFLREGAFTLQEAGFPVLLPEGLVRPAA
ncbi:MAG TPA: hypothetical protein VNT75_22475, partial [Symbiobacteriaceae bacterium]|nr:hypothetical protein [Symbiobacteriaceae bacterium]